MAELSSCDTLLISNLPENADEFLIEMYFESAKSGGCEGAIERVHFVEPEVAQVQFKDYQGEKHFSTMFYYDLSLSILVAKNVLSTQVHILQGSELKVQYYSDEPEDVVGTVPETDTLEVRNLPRDVSADELQLYFESPKSGGCADSVKDVTLLKSGVAHVQLLDAAGEYMYVGKNKL